MAGIVLSINILALREDLDAAWEWLDNAGSSTSAHEGGKKSVAPTPRRRPTRFTLQEGTASNMDDKPPMRRRTLRRRPSAAPRPQAREGSASNMAEASLTSARSGERRTVRRSAQRDVEQPQDGQARDCTPKPVRARASMRERSSIRSTNRMRRSRGVHSDDESDAPCDTWRSSIAYLAHLSPTALVDALRKTSMCDGDLPEEACLDMRKVSSICNGYEALGAPVYPIREPEETFFVDGEADMLQDESLCEAYEALDNHKVAITLQESDGPLVDCGAEMEVDSICSEETDVPYTAGSDQDYLSDADEDKFAVEEVHRRRSSSERYCQKCHQIAVKGIADTCGSCRKDMTLYGQRGRARSCVSCAACFSGFRDTCEDCP